MTKTFDKTYLTEKLVLPYSKYVVSDTITDTGRWNIEHELIFLDPADNKYYRTSYREGATELQDERPWEYDKTVEAVEVEKKLVIKEEFVAEGEQVQDLNSVLASIINECKDNSREEYTTDQLPPTMMIYIDKLEKIIHSYERISKIKEGYTQKEEFNEEKFQQFVKDLKNKFALDMNGIIDLNTESNIHTLSSNARLSDKFFVFAGEYELDYQLSSLYTMYQNAEGKPMETVMSYIKEQCNECIKKSNKDIDIEKFQKFCKKLKKKLSNVFDGQHETNLNDLSDRPAVDDVLEIYCENNKTLSGCKTLSYNLLGLYRTYLEYKKNQAYKPTEIIVNSIADDYETCCAEMEVEEELD